MREHERAVQRAVKHFVAESVGLRFGAARRRDTVAQIRASKRPLTAAKKLLASRRRELDARQFDPDRIDHSAVQELEVAMVKRHRVLCPEHQQLLRRLDRMVAESTRREAFDKIAHIALTLPSSLPRGFGWAT